MHDDQQETETEDRDLYDLIRDGYFDPKLKYPSKPIKPMLGPDHTSYDVKVYLVVMEEWEKDMKKYVAAMDAYRKEQGDLQTKFREMALEYCGISEHRRANKAWGMAWDRGHSGHSGHSSVYTDVLINLVELADLLL